MYLMIRLEILMATIFDSDNDNFKLIQKLKLLKSIMKEFINFLSEKKMSWDFD